jgi:hypothetical protein
MVTFYHYYHTQFPLLGQLFQYFQVKRTQTAHSHFCPQSPARIAKSLPLTTLSSVDVTALQLILNQTPKGPRPERQEPLY